MTISNSGQLKPDTENVKTNFTTEEDQQVRFNPQAGIIGKTDLSNYRELSPSSGIISVLERFKTELKS